MTDQVKTTDHSGAIAALSSARRDAASKAYEAALMGYQEGALADFNHAIKINSRYPEAYANRGFVLLQQGKRIEADHDFTRSMTLKPSVRPFIERRIVEISQQ